MTERKSTDRVPPVQPPAEMKLKDWEERRRIALEAFQMGKKVLKPAPGGKAARARHPRRPLDQRRSA